MSFTTAKNPTVTKYAPHEISVSLNEFEAADVADYLRDQGYCIDGYFGSQIIAALRSVNTRRRVNTDDDPEYEEGAFILASELAHAKKLLLCGQREAARELILSIVSTEMGRAL